MKCWTNPFLVFVFVCGCSESPPEVLPARSQAALTGTELRSRDLAVAFPLNSEYLVKAEDRLAHGAALLSEDWYRDIEAAFDGTGAEGALYYENYYADWKLVSARWVPCSALGATVSADNDTLCWPEVRLVLQPILYNLRLHARFSPAFADDRAIHALYDVAPEQGLAPEQARRAWHYVTSIRAGETLTRVQREDFLLLRDQVVREFVRAILALRDPGLSAEDYEGFDLRPETWLGPAAEQALRERMSDFVGRFAPARQLRELTAFSLPFGREPAHLDEWVFVAFGASEGALVPKDILLTDHITGQTLFNYGPQLSASQSQDDPRIHAVSNPAIEASVIMDRNDVEELGAVIADRGRRLVPHTSCASCHKLNDLTFDFHNFGYLEDRDLTISPRVVRDVELDLAWLQRDAQP